MTFDDVEARNCSRQAAEPAYITTYYGRERRLGIRVVIGGRVRTNGRHEGTIVDTPAEGAARRRGDAARPPRHLGHGVRDGRQGARELGPPAPARCRAGPARRPPPPC